MTESDGDIEYLEEDAEIVQQCVQLANYPNPASEESVAYSPRKRSDSLLVERRKSQKRKKKVEEDDSEYDPSEDEPPPSPPSPPARKKRVTRSSKKMKKSDDHEIESSNRKVPNIPFTIYNVKEEKTLSAVDVHLLRKKYNIRIPDFDDPLCLPVRAFRTDESDIKKLDNWNNVCLEHFKHCDTMLKPEQGSAKGSVRTAVFKHVVNKQTGNNETTIWSKTSVENEEGDKKSEIFQCVLPRYREKKAPANYTLSHYKHHITRKIVDEVILTKEEHDDGEALVVYRPGDSISTVYGLIDKRKKAEDEEEEAPPSRKEDSKLYLQEMTTCKLCTPCFQASWRGLDESKQKATSCPVCGRSQASAHALIAHYRAHRPADARRYRAALSQALARMVGYHYSCRVCGKQLPSIKALRSHVTQHQSPETFTCEVCDRVVNER